MRAAPRNGSNIAKMKIPSYSGTLWWYSNNSRIDEIHAYSIQMEGVHLPQMKFVDFSIHCGKWNDSGRKGEGQGSTGSLSLTTESFWKGPGGGEASFWLHSSSKSTWWNSCILGTIVEGAGLRIAILANEIICNHGLRHNTRRLHWLCDCSERRSSNFREAYNTKASTQSYADVQVACAAAAACSQGRRK